MIDEQIMGSQGNIVWTTEPPYLGYLSWAPCLVYVQNWDALFALPRLSTDAFLGCVLRSRRLAAFV